MARTTALAGVVALCLLFVTLERSPLVWVDEVYFVSSARDVAAGGQGIPDIEPTSAVSFPFTLLHGPVFFWLEGQSVTRLGLSPTSGRLVSFGGAILTVLALAALVLVLTGSTTWALVAFGVAVLTPEIGSTASNARMDTLAVALELWGLTAFVWGVMRQRAVASGLVAGVILGAAVLTTQRVFPFGAAVGLATLVALALGKPFDRKTLILASAITGALVLAFVAAWAAHWDVSPAGWLSRMRAADRDFPMITVGVAKRWAASVPNLLAFVLLVPAAAIAWFGTRGDTRPQLGPARFVVGLGAVATLANIVLENDVFLRSIHFVMLTLAGTIGLGYFLRNAPRRHFIRLGAVSLLLFSALRAVKTVDTFETWEARSPYAFDSLVAQHVPAGSTVVGYDEFYFYAVERHGATFRSFRPDPWQHESQSLRTAWDDRIRRTHAPQPDAGFLLWPDDPHWPMPESLACAAANPIARYDAPPLRSVLDRLPVIGALGYLRRYPSTVLYRVPAGCRI